MSKSGIEYKNYTSLSEACEAINKYISAIESELDKYSNLVRTSFGVDGIAYGGTAGGEQIEDALNVIRNRMSRYRSLNDQLAVAINKSGTKTAIAQNQSNTEINELVNT